MIKKFALFLTLTSLIINLFTFNVFAAETPTVSLGSASGETGDLVSIPVTLSEQINFSNIGIEIGYDSNALAIREVVPAKTTAIYTASQTYADNPYNINYNSVSNTEISGDIAIVTFEILTEVVGDYEITLNYYKGRNGTYKDGINVNYDEDYQPLGLSYKGGRITVTGDGKPEPVTVWADTVKGCKGDEVTINVTLDGNTGFANLGIEIGYNRNELVLKSVTPSGDIKATYLGAEKLTANPYNMTWFSNEDTDYNGILATLTFEVVAEKFGEYPVTVDFYKGRKGNYVDGVNVNYNKDFEDINLEYISGKVENLISCDVEFSLDTNDGTVWAALYDKNNVLQRLVTLKPQPELNITFDKDADGSYVKVMWWNDNMKPVCEAKVISLK